MAKSHYIQGIAGALTDQYFGKRTRQTVDTDENRTIRGMMIRTVWICPTIQRVPLLSLSLALCIAYCQSTEGHQLFRVDVTCSRVSEVDF